MLMNDISQPWLLCMERFAIFIKNYDDPSERLPEIKVALIDDGVDATHGSLSRCIADGVTYLRRTERLYSPYYKSTRGHGTVMATLIRKICPGAKILVARLDEERTNNGHEITAASATKVRVT